MKVLIVGDWLSDIYEKAIYTGFKNLGCDTEKFSWIQYFKYYQYPEMRESKGNFILSLYYRVQNKYIFGPILKKINNDLICKVNNSNYDLVFIYRGTHIYPNTIDKIKKTGSKVFGYNNDDPFSISYNKLFWRNFINSVKCYDHMFVYRHKNLKDYKELGFVNTSLLRSYSIKERNFYISKSEITQEYRNDIIFIGHYEDDGRDLLILDILKSGIGLKVYGTNWNKSRLIGEIESFCGEIKPTYDNYNLLLNGAKIALVLLSKKNNDTYTRRVFEISSTSAVMLSEYTDDLNYLFDSESEIVFFKTRDECVKKINYLLENESNRRLISQKAYEKSKKIGHEVTDRVKVILDVYDNFK